MRRHELGDEELGGDPAAVAEQAAGRAAGGWPSGAERVLWRFRTGAPGATYPGAMGRVRRSTTASSDGGPLAFGTVFSTRSRKLTTVTS